jgi:hypothetical protein
MPEVAIRSRAKGGASFLWLWTVLVSYAGLAGCAEAVGPLAREALDPLAREAVAAKLRAINDPANQKEIEILLTSEPVERSTRTLTRAVVDAALADLGSEERQVRAKKLAADFVRDLGPVLGSVLDEHVLPRVQREVEESVRKLLDQALSEEGQRRTGVFVAGVARQAMGTIAPAVQRTVERAIADGVSAGIDRSLRNALAGSLTPAIGKALDANAPAISRAMRAGTAGALQGVADAMNGPFGAMLRSERQAAIKETADAAAAERKVWFEKLDAELAESRRWLRTLVLLAAVGGVLLLGLGLLLWRLLHENRRLRTGV